jgi:hypothetical protein
MLGNLIVVVAKVNGKPARLILDTCAGVSLLTPEAAKKFGTGEGMEINIGGAGDAARKARLVQLDSLECAGRSGKSQPAVITELPAGGGEKADGILGMPFLAKFVLKIDYDRKTVSLLAPGAPAPQGAGVLALARRMGLPEVEAEIDGLKGRVRLDSGYGGSFTFTSPTVAKEKLKDRYPRRIETVTGQGLGGASIGEAVRTGLLTLGGLSLTGVVSYLSADKGGALADSGTIGLVGGEVLNRFIVTFDFPAGKLYLEKGKRFTETFVGPRAGFSGVLESDGSYRVRTVTQESPAARAGLVVGDLLLSIDGTTVGALGVHGIRAALRRAPGTSLTLQIKSQDGSSKERTIVLKELL